MPSSKHEQAVRGFRAEQIFEFDGGFCGSERGDALMVARAGKAIELLAVLEAHRNIARFRDADNLADALAVPSAAR